MKLKLFNLTLLSFILGIHISAQNPQRTGYKNLYPSQKHNFIRDNSSAVYVQTDTDIPIRDNSANLPAGTDGKTINRKQIHTIFRQAQHTTSTGATVTLIVYTEAEETEENLFFPKTEVYPNPFSEIAILRVNHLIQGTVVCTVYDITGRAVKYVEVTPEEEQPHALDIKLERKSLPAGIYLYSVSDENDFTSSGKIVIQ